MCCKAFTKKTHYTDHINRKYQCSQDDVMGCDACTKQFSRKDALKRHKEKYCVINNTMVQTITTMQQEIAELKRQNQQLINVGVGTMNNTATTNSNNNITIHNHNNIMLVPFGTEDMSKLDQEDLIDIINFGFNAGPETMRKLHFNSRLPEYRNVFVDASLNNAYVVVDNNQWEKRDPDDVATMSYERHKDHFLKLVADKKLMKKADSEWSLEAKEYAEVMRTTPLYSDIIKEKIKKCLLQNRSRLGLTREQCRAITLACNKAIES